MTDDLFTIVVPEEDMEPPSYQEIPSGQYRSTLQPGVEVANSDSGWEAVQMFFEGFTSKKTGEVYNGRPLRASFTTKLSMDKPTHEKAIEIGTRGLVSAAFACGLTETVDGGGKSAQKLTASSMDELVGQFNAMAGTEVLVYVKTGPRKDKGDGRHLKNDGTPWIDSEVGSVRPLPSEDA